MLKIEATRGYGHCYVVPKRALRKEQKQITYKLLLLTFIKLIGKRGLKDGGLAQILNV